jgi:hypothetical protein
MVVSLVYCADWLTCEVPYYADTKTSWGQIRDMRAHSSPATSLVNDAVFTHNKVVANIEPSIGVHVVILVGTDYGSALCLGRAEWGGAPVVYYDGWHRSSHRGGCAARGSCVPFCSADNIRASYWIKESLRISIHCVPCIVLRSI